MKKSLIALLILGATLGNGVNANAENSGKQLRAAESKAHVDKMVSLLYEIKSIDKTKLKIYERRELKKEVAGIKSDLLKYQREPVIYVSLGAAILIAILLLLLL